MIVEYWGVGMATAFGLPMTTGDISGHLLEDWIPSLPSTVSSSFVGWPPFLIDVARMSIGNCLALRAEAGRTERQWKGVLSWMLGVAGARHVLKSEGYRWVAPLSAFYPESTQDVDLSDWNVSFPRSAVVAERQPNNPSRLRPDYLALRPLASSQPTGTYEWAVAEAKGTKWNLTNGTLCPGEWSRQARNVSLTVNGSPATIQRHLVVATRVNPNAVYLQTRRLQVRAWNSDDDSRIPVPPEAIVDVVAAHLVGFFKNVRLRETARAIALSMHTAHATGRGGGVSAVPTVDRGETIRRSEDELRAKTEVGSQGTDRATIVPVDTELGTIKVSVAAPTISLVRRLREAHTVDQCASAVREADQALDEWAANRRGRPARHEQATLSLGAEVIFPSDVWGRR